MSRAFLLVTSALLTACSQEPAPPPAEQAPAEQQQPTPVPAQPAPAPQPAAADVLTAEGWGPLKIGMTRAEITKALGPDANPQAVGGADPEQCDQYRPRRAPEGMLLMVEKGRLTRISIGRNASVRTDKGVGLGATPEEVRAAHPGKVEPRLHKYEPKPAEYLTVWVKGGKLLGRAFSNPTEPIVLPSSRGIVYEVNSSGKVGMIHAGGPSILYVEGCS